MSLEQVWLEDLVVVGPGQVTWSSSYSVTAVTCWVLRQDIWKIDLPGERKRKLGKKYKSSEILGNSETRSQICTENRSRLREGDILSSERSPRGNAFSGHPERSERAQHDSIL